MKTTIYTVLCLSVVFLHSCNANQKIESEVSSEEIHVAPIDHVLTQAARDSLTPAKVKELFVEGNYRFTHNNLTARDHSEQIRKSTEGQFPKAIVLSCVDSRVPVEDVFDRGIGDIFVARVAGNFVNEDILGSMEYACKVAGSKLILVLGHEHCGAVKAAIDHVELGNITGMLSNITPVVDSMAYEGDRTSKNMDFVHKVCEGNINHTIEQIRMNSPILKEMEDLGQIEIIGGYYDMDNGKVTFMD
jgi:carbonic anhydrase